MAISSVKGENLKENIRYHNFNFPFSQGKTTENVAPQLFSYKVLFALKGSASSPSKTL